MDPFTLAAAGNAVKKAVGPATAVGPALVGEIGGQLTFAARKNRELAKRAYSDMVNNRLGLTNAQKTQAAGQAARSISAATAPQAEMLRRQAAAGGIGSAGAMADQQAALAGSVASAQAQAQQGIEAQSQQQALAKQAQTMAMLAQREATGKEDWRRIGSLLQSGKGQMAPVDTSFVGRASQYAQTQGA